MMAGFDGKGSNPALFLLTDSLHYDIRPPPVGKSETNEHPRRQSVKPVSPRPPQYDQGDFAHPAPSHSRSQPNFDFAKGIEDSLRLSKLRTQKSSNTVQSRQRDSLVGPGRPLELPQRSMPSLYPDYQALARQPPLAPAHVQQAALVSDDSYLQHAYERILQRRSLLTAIRSGSNFINSYFLLKCLYISASIL